MGAVRPRQRALAPAGVPYRLICRAVHLLLTDRLTCPRCGPRFGLILLADRMEERRVVDGKLGCPNCRDGYPVRAGFGDLRAPPRGEVPPGRAGEPGEPDPDEVARVQALLGIIEGPGTLALVGGPARLAAALAARVANVEVVAVDADMGRWPETAGVSRMVARPGLPFFDRTLRGVVVDGGTGDAWIRESARVLVRLGRVVVVGEEGCEGRVREVLESAGLDVLACEAGTVVAARA